MEQSSPGGPASVTIGLNLLGLDNAQACGCEPPDTNAAVGDTQVVEWVNVAYEVFNKTYRRHRGWADSGQPALAEPGRRLRQQ